MEKIKEKKVYPSEMNTKSIACRIPISDYVKFLQEANEKGMNLNDWLLIKVYGDNGSNIGSPENDFIFSNKDFNNITKYNKDYNNPKYEFALNCMFKNIKQFYGNTSSKEALLLSICNYINDIDYYGSKVDELEMRLLEYENRRADINDVRNQLTILINERFKDLNDRKEFRKEILPLLKELE